jgi:predicted RNase H-like HicB family nuclease
MRHILLYQDEDGVWIATVPSLPGCVSDGATIDEALRNVDEAVEGYIESLQAHGDPVPQEPGGMIMVRREQAG